MGMYDRDWMRDSSPTLADRWQQLPVAARWVIIAVTVLALVLLIYYARARNQRPSVADEEALLWAITQDDAQEVDRILEQHPSLAQPGYDFWGESPLLIACHSGATESLQVLVERGADVNTRGIEGATPLHIAAIGGDVEVVTALLKLGADPTAVDKDGDTPLMAVLKQPQGSEPVIVRALLEHGADPNLRVAGGMTPLHRAAWTGDVKTARLLLAHDADPLATDDDGYTPLMAAAQGPSQGSVEIAQALIDKGADVNHRGNDGIVAVQLARRAKNAAMVALLVKHGATD